MHVERDKWSAAQAAIVAAPFGVSAYWVAFRLDPVESPDAFSYVWRAPFSLGYFAGRSLTQRFLYSLCGAEPRAIVVLQLATAALVALSAFLLLRRPDRPVRNFAVATAIALLASSFNFTLGTIVLTPEPIFLQLMITFPLALGSYRGKHRGPLLFALGSLATFSRNTAPAIVLIQLFIHAAAVLGRGRVRLNRWLLALSGVALSSMLLTQAFDTSVQLNAANNVMKRVLPDREETEHYRHHHGLPLDEDLSELRGANVLARLHGDKLFRVVPQTQNYAMDPGRHAILRWVVERGSREYWWHEIFHDPAGAASAVAAGLSEMYDASAVTYLSRFAESHATDRRAARHNLRALLGRRFRESERFDEAAYLQAHPDVAEAVRQGEIASGRDHYHRFGRSEGRSAGIREQSPMPVGLLPFDPLAETTRAFRIVFFNQLAVLCVVLILAVAGTRRSTDGRDSLTGALLLGGSLVGFTLGFLGDGMDHERHVSTSVVTITLALWMLIGSAATRAARSGAAARLARSLRKPTMA